VKGHCFLWLAIAACGRIDFDPLGGGSFTGVRRQLRLDRIDPIEQLADFPLPVVLDDTRADRTQLAPDASDLRFFDSSGAVLPREIEQVGAPGGLPLVAWVRVPLIVGLTTTIDMEYGAPPTATSSASVWSDTYLGVWHLAELGGAAADSTSHHFDAVVTPGTGTDRGVVGGARAFSGADYLEVPDTSMITPATFTLSGWMKMFVPTAAYYAMIAREVGDSTDNDLYLGVLMTQGIVLCEQANVQYKVLGGTATVDVWQHWAGTFDGSVQHLFLDGIEVGMTAVPGPLQSDLRPLIFGADRDGTSPPGLPDVDWVSGDLDELRVESTARDPAWLAYEDAAMRDRVISY
jgi:hypothetical protein